jgi:uncharacterized protein with beta-barrel porin domain
VIPQLPQTPNVGSNVANDLWKWLIEMGNRIRALIDWVNGYTEPTTVPSHKDNHATGGSDALTPDDIGAATSTHNHDSTYAKIAQGSWIAPTLLNSWVNFGSPWSTAGYYKDTVGNVHLRGTLKSGTINNPCFTLPSGYLPGCNLVYPIYNNSTTDIGGVVVYPNGNVTCVAGTNVAIYLDNIIFRAEA